MTAALVTVDQDRDRVDLIKRTVAKGTTDDEFSLFLHACKRTGLDPLMKQIHAVKRGGQMSIQTGIDGYRLIADRTGKYAGNDDPIFEEDDNSTAHRPTKATVTVYKLVEGVRCGFSASARWDEYHPGEAQGFMWKKMPHVMLGKCAEALALRKAFPAEMSGIYTNEEMQQADRLPPGPTVEVVNKHTGEEITVPETRGRTETLPEEITPDMPKPTLDQEILDAANKAVAVLGGTVESQIHDASYFEIEGKGKFFTDPARTKSEKWKQKTLGRLRTVAVVDGVRPEDVPF